MADLEDAWGGRFLRCGCQMGEVALFGTLQKRPPGGGRPLPGEAGRELDFIEVFQIGLELFEAFFTCPKSIIQVDLERFKRIKK